MNKTNFLVVYSLFFLLIVTLPFNTLLETVAFTTGKFTDKTQVLTPIYLKVYKDIFLFTAFFLVVFTGGFVRFSKRILPFYLILGFIVLFALAALANHNVVTVLLGLRSYLPIIFIAFGFYFYRFDPATLFPVLRVLLFIELAVQILQFIYAPPYYGSLLFGYNLTNPGTFLIPSTMASFALLVFYYARQRGDNVTALLALVSVVMSRSSTALFIVIIYVVVVVIKGSGFSNGVLVMVLTLGACIIFMNLELVTGREAIGANLDSRLDIFRNSLSQPLGRGFGLGSGAVVLAHQEGAIIADSTINSLLINFGWLGFFIYLVFVVRSAQTFDHKNILFISFVCFSLTMIVFEMTPFIQFYFFELGRALRKNEQLADGIR